MLVVTVVVLAGNVEVIVENKVTVMGVVIVACE